MPSVERLKKQYLEFAVFTLITVIIWIGYGVYTALTHPADVAVSAEELRQLPSDLQIEELQKLKQRLSISEEELASFAPSRLESVSFSELQSFTEESIPSDTSTPTAESASP